MFKLSNFIRKAKQKGALTLSLLLLITFFSSISFLETKAEGLSLSEQGYDKILIENKISKSITTDKDSFKNTIRGIFITTDANGAIGPSVLLKSLNIIVGAVAILFLVILGVKIIFAQGEEESLTKHRKEFAMVAAGAILIGLAQYLAFSILDPLQGDLLNADADSIIGNALSDKIKMLIRGVEIIIAAIALVGMTVTAFKLITSQGEEETINNEKNFIKNFILGLIMILFAETIIQIYSSLDSQSLTNDPAETVAFGIAQILGLISFVLSFVAIAAVIMFVIACIYLLISLGDDDKVERAKRIIINCVIGIIICVSAYSIVNFFIV